MQYQAYFILIIFSTQIFSLLANSLNIPHPPDSESEQQQEQDENEITDFDNLPGEPLNPSEFELAKHFEEDKERNHGSEVYSKEMMPEQLYSRNGLTDARYRWPKIGQYAVIPYVISTRFDQTKRLFILKAFENFHGKTCVKFVPRINQKDYVNIIYGEGCDSDAGRVGGEQKLSLGQDCDYTDIAIHELNHAVGFWHEQNRPDRDNHISVYLENVIPENRFNFDKMSYTTIQTYGQKYDTDSIMHYDQWAFSKNYGKLAVMKPKVPNENMGLAKVLSTTDIAKINAMYKCQKIKDMRKTRIGSHSNPTMKKFLVRLRSGENCMDLHSNCTKFAQVKLKIDTTCSTNLWMKVNCRKACNFCDEPCEDVHPQCTSWSQNGACEEHSDYMNLYCPKSCLKC